MRMMASILNVWIIYVHACCSCRLGTSTSNTINLWMLSNSIWSNKVSLRMRVSSITIGTRKFFLEYCKTCEHTEPFNWGTTGCWSAAFHVGHCFCVHIMVPTFSKDSTSAECEAEIEKLCKGHHAVNVWMSMCDMHPSEKTGQAQNDVHKNTAGKWLLCKFIVMHVMNV